MIQFLQVEWNGGSESKDEILERILQREEATIKRERALAYAFSHQVLYKKKNISFLFAIEKKSFNLWPLTVES